MDIRVVRVHGGLHIAHGNIDGGLRLIQLMLGSAAPATPAAKNTSIYPEDSEAVVLPVDSYVF